MRNQEEAITAYFNRLDRSDFIEKKDLATQLDNPVAIGFGQTISQPSLILQMTLALDMQPDSKVLEIGTGSGFQTALLAAFSKEVYTVERIEALHKKAKSRLHAQGFVNIRHKHGDGSSGWPEHQPYDRIMVTAAASEVPDELLGQLSENGKMIIPVGDDHSQQLRLIEKDVDGAITSSVLERVVFVRLKGKYA